jgi:hypothetical protein
MTTPVLYLNRRRALANSESPIASSDVRLLRGLVKWGVDEYWRLHSAPAGGTVYAVHAVYAGGARAACDQRPMDAAAAPRVNGRGRTTACES